MASRKHHKQDSTRPTKARERRMRGHVPPVLDELGTENERAVEPIVTAHGEG